MKRLLSDKVLRRLVLGNLLLGGLLALATWLSLRANYQADLDLGVAVTRHQARSLSLELTAEMRMVDNALATIAGRYRGRSQESPGEAAIVLYDLLQEQRGLIPFVTALRVADARGQVMLTANEDEPAFSVADRAYFERARHSEQMVVSDPLISHSFHQWAIVLARRLQSADGQFQGIVYAIVAAEHFQSLFRRQAFGPDSAMALRSDRDLLVARYTAADPRSMAGVGGSEVSREYHHALGNDRELGWYITPTLLDGVERITAYHRLAGYPLTVFTGLGTDNYLAAWRASAWRAWALTGLSMLLIALGSVSLYLLQQRERVARLKLSELLRQQELFMDNDLIGIARLRERRLLWTNQALQRMLKRPADELRNTSARILYPDEETYERSGELAYGALRSSGKCHTQMQLQTRDGGLLWVDVSGAGLADGESIWVFVDIDALKRGEQAARHLALHDALTGLANRRALEMRLQRELAQAGGPGQLAVCFMDLDGFKQVNDTEGHDAGDEVLRIVARRLTTLARETDCVARLGGDEFVVLLGDLVQADDAQQVMQRCLASICQPIRLQGGATVRVGASMGIALNLPQEDAAQLLQRADEAMYAAKRAGKGRIVVAGE
ncbi:Diguanylate cyclase DosC [Delftia tsuruhatensis]|uniref:sensor domain-containing diguanylate cyclase n=1 Tax=Delftia tsuruhatensis TaxID=180282 RepID=UPI001E80F986|nr:diguanylate cyclase [Delftia tsuruhatensis]CAB5686646.1 Diguanylate cyclase DosC [Delftia tsuruhatensis]CAC9690471.1 Diguanylate cyclase DosC [Delftia tsuruhatensis]